MNQGVEWDGIELCFMALVISLGYKRQQQPIRGLIDIFCSDPFDPILSTLQQFNSLPLNMAIEIVDFHKKKGDFPVRYVKFPEGTYDL